MYQIPPWIRERYGAVEIQAPKEPLFVIDDLIEATGEATLTVCVHDHQGNPLPDVAIVFYWKDAPELPLAGWYARGVVTTTDDNGRADCPMGPGAYYDPQEDQGGHAVWVFGEGMSEMINGLGMITGTYDHLHVKIRYQVTTEDPWEQITKLITRAIQLLRQARTAIP